MIACCIGLADGSSTAASSQIVCGEYLARKCRMLKIFYCYIGIGCLWMWLHCSQVSLLLKICEGYNEFGIIAKSHLISSAGNVTEAAKNGSSFRK